MSDLLGSIMNSMGEAPKKDANANKTNNSRLSAGRGQPPQTSMFSSSFGRIPKKQPGSSNADGNKRPAAESFFNRMGPIPKKSLIENIGAGHSLITSDYVNVQLNMFDVNISKMPEVIQRLHMDVIIIFNNGKTVEISKEKIGTGDLANQRKRWGLWNVWKCVVRARPDLFSGQQYSVGAYDCGSAIYLPNGIYRGSDKEVVEIELNTIDEKTASPILQMGRREIVKVIAKLMPTGFVYTNQPRSMEPGNVTELVRCIEVVTSQILNSRDYFQFGNSTFKRSSDKCVDRSRMSIKDPAMQFDSEGKELKTGFEKSVRMVSGNGDSKYPSLLMTIDCRRSPFYQEMSATRMFSLLLQSDRKSDGLNFSQCGIGRDVASNCFVQDVSPGVVRNAIAFMKGQSKDYVNSVLDEMRGIAVIPLHIKGGTKSAFYIYEFETKGAKSISFDVKSEDGETRKLSIYDYFIEKYNYRLQYPDLPLAVERKFKSISYFPLEVLQVPRGQRVKQHNIPACIRSEMAGKLAMLPKTHIQLHREILADNLKAGDNKFMDAFGISIGENNFQPVKLRAKILPAPVIEFFAKRSVQPETGIGKVPIIKSDGTRYFRSARVNTIVVINFDNISLSLPKFCEAFAESCRTRGVIIDAAARNWKIENCKESDFNSLKAIMEKAKAEKASLVLAITKSKRPDVHDTLKMLESKLGIQTYHLAQQTCQKVVDHSSKTTDNVIRKLNLKCGGLNFNLSVPQKARNVTICKNRKELNEKFYKNTMFVGFELSHAGATCMFDKQYNIVCGEPSVVGVSYSLGESTNLGGFTYLQQPREHKLMKLLKYFPKTVLDYYRCCKELPEKIVVYRSGTGEGDFSKLKNEANEMRKSLKESAEICKLVRGDYNPQFLFVVMLKNSHYRVFPEEIRGEKSFEQNVPSGTLIDTTVTVFGFHEFILVSQSALIGSVRPVRYTILVNDVDWTINEVAHLTYFSAFGHQVSYQPPGMPHVLYGAENLAKRGRNNFKAHQKCNNIRRRKDGELDDDDGTNIDILSEQLNSCTLTSKNFWA